MISVSILLLWGKNIGKDMHLGKQVYGSNVHLRSSHRMSDQWYDLRSLRDVEAYSTSCRPKDPINFQLSLSVCI